MKELFGVALQITLAAMALAAVHEAACIDGEDGRKGTLRSRKTRIQHGRSSS
jgi:hypothetical protein